MFQKQCLMPYISQIWSKRWFTVLAKAAAKLLSCPQRFPQIKPGGILNDCCFVPTNQQNIMISSFILFPNGLIWLILGKSHFEENQRKPMNEGFVRMKRVK